MSIAKMLPVLLIVCQLESKILDPKIVEAENEDDRPCALLFKQGIYFIN